MKKVSRQEILHVGAIASLLALALLCLVWEAWLAPLRPGGSWLALKAVPLLFPLYGVIKRDVYTMQWASMGILLYFAEGAVRAFSDQNGTSAMLAGAEAALAGCFYFCTVFYLRPFKKAAQEEARKALERAARRVRNE